MVILLHATVNLPVTLAIEELGSRATVPVLLYWVLMAVAAIVVVIWAGPERWFQGWHEILQRWYPPAASRS